MADRWFPKSIAQEHVEGGFTVTLTTDTGCHLWLYWTDKEPWVHRRSTVDRGLIVPWASYWCYTAWHTIEQNEAGDTTTHTFDWLGWEVCQTKWFTFHGDIAGEESPSSGPILHKHYTAPPPPPPTSEVRLFAYRDFVTQQPLAIRTQVVEDDGTIAPDLIDTETVDPYAGYPALIHVSGNVYLVLYSLTTGGPMMARTYEITPDGEITDAPLFTRVIDAVLGNRIRLLHIAGEVFAVAYSGPGTDGWIKTISCTPAGVIGPVIASLEFETSHCEFNNFTHIAGTTYTVVYTGPGIDGWLKTIKIDNDGTIPGVIDSWEFDPSQAGTPNIVHVAGTVYALLYAGPSWYFRLRTLSIADNGIITKVFIDSLLKSINILFCAMKRGLGNYFVIKTPGPLYLATIFISDAGDIGADFTDTYAFSGLGLFDLAPGYFLTFYGVEAKTFVTDSDGDIVRWISRQSLTGHTLYEPTMITLTPSA